MLNRLLINISLLVKTGRPWQADIWSFCGDRNITRIVSWQENNGCYVIKLNNTLKDGQISV